MAYWICRCVCGEESSVSGRYLRSGLSTQCKRCGHGYETLTGRVFGKWTVVSRMRRRDCSDNRIWVCRCECGHIQRHASSSLNKGLSRSCKHCSERPMFRLRPYEALFIKASRSARRDGHEFTIPYEEFVSLVAPSCHYCGTSLKWAEYCVAKNGQGYNLDRKDNSIGYVPGNLVACCDRCNRAKGNRFTYPEWYAMTKPFRDGTLKALQPAVQAA